MVRLKLAIALAAALPGAAWGQVRIGAELQVNTHTTGVQGHAGVASDADGNFVVTWVSYAPNFSTAAVFARRYDASGVALEAAEFQVSEATAGYDGYPFVASGQTGNFAVVWRNDANSFDVFARPYDPSGTPGTAFRVNSYTTFSQSPGGVASDAIGNFVVVWNTFLEDGSYGGVAARRYDAFGVPRGPQFQVNSYTPGYQYASSVGSDAYGNFLVAWHSDDQDGDGRGIFAQRYDAAGDAQGLEFQVNSYTTGDQGGPSVASDLAGNFVVVWAGSDGSGRGVFGQRYDLSGSPQGGEFRVNTFTTAEQRFPVVSADAKGFVVASTSFGQDNSSYAAMARRYDTGGVALGGEFLVNSYTTNRQDVSSVASAADGSFVVVWSSLNQDGDNAGVFAQRFASDLIFRDGFD